MNLSEFERRVKQGMEEKPLPLSIAFHKAAEPSQSDLPTGEIHRSFAPRRLGDQANWVERLKPPPRPPMQAAPEPPPSEPVQAPVQVGAPKTVVKEKTSLRGSGYGTITFLLVSIITMSAYLAMGGPRLIWPPHEYDARAGENSGAALASQQVHERVRLARRGGAQGRDGALRAGYLGPKGDFVPAAADLTKALPERAIGAWDSATRSVGDNVASSGYTDLGTGLTARIASFLGSIADQMGSLVTQGNGQESVGGLGLNMPMLVGIGAFGAVLVLCLAAVIGISARAREPKVREFRLDGNYR